MEICMKHVKEAPEPPSARCGKPVSPRLEALLVRCLAKSLSDRPADAAALLTGLRQGYSTKHESRNQQEKTERVRSPCTVRSSPCVRLKILRSPVRSRLCPLKQTVGRTKVKRTPLRGTLRHRILESAEVFRRKGVSASPEHPVSLPTESTSRAARRSSPCLTGEAAVVISTSASTALAEVELSTHGSLPSGRRRVGYSPISVAYRRTSQSTN